MIFLLPCLLLIAHVEAIVRQYYIAAEEVDWEYYTDRTFTNAIPHDPYLGLLGPIIRAEVGDRIKVDFMNRATKPYSLHPHTHLDKQPLLPGQKVAPGHGYHFVWDIPTTTKFPANQSSLLWVYLSKANAVADLHAGLIGPIVIYQQGYLTKTSPNSMFPSLAGGQVQEIFALMMTTDENLLNEDEHFLESNRMYHINGFLYNNNPDLRMYYGKPTRWYVVSFGADEEDVHTAHWHGSTLLHHGHRVDVIDLTPTSFEVLDMMPDNEGQWLFHCHVVLHFDAGMTAFYQVEKLEYTGEEGWDK
ncbi:Cupredoxin [Hesseltinella vesiculosa]|uniref:Cupredoxin n=1 Tax=Hesseltinella vesiculosa TaxID=101127 RepID=A0A1X2GM22_9FUNG|nr:Cupredoxin [Hesseltinella vesiculosa]